MLDNHLPHEMCCQVLPPCFLEDSVNNYYCSNVQYSSIMKPNGAGHFSLSSALMGCSFSWGLIQVSYFFP